MGIRTTLVTLGLWLAIASATGSAKTIYVDGDAPGPNNGTSWTNAFKNLQDALAQATQGDEVWVAQGTYRPDKGAGQTAGDRTATFQLADGVKIYGGYPGYGQPKPNARNIQANPSVLSGDLLANDRPMDTSSSAVIRDLLADATRQDNSYVVVTGSGADSAAVLSGFTITGGVANSGTWPNMYPGQGAGLFVYKGAPAVQDCRFKENLSAAGGAAVAGRESQASFTNCTFANNMSINNGGAITSWSSAMTIGQCTFTANRSDDNRQDEVGIHWSGLGGAIYNWSSRLAVTGSTFERNGGCFDGGALFTSHGSDANLVDCRFVANTSTSGGGAIENTDSASLTLTRCVFLQNTAWSSGGAIRCMDAKATLNQCRFLANSTNNTGGALYNLRSDIALVGCVFSGNTAPNIGAATAHEACTTAVINCTFASNVSAGGGAAIGCLPSSTTSDVQSWLHVINSVLWDQANEILSQDRTVPIVLYSDIFDELGLGQWTVWANEHNLSKDPLFVNALGTDGVAGTEDDNLRLGLGSPCIDSGDNGWVPSGTTIDADGNKRFVDDPDSADTGSGQAPIVDRGAYEYVKRVPGPAKPVANAGPDRTAFAWLDNLARVTLDGSASSDADGDPLAYAWTWKVGTTNYQATGATAEITLPVGATTITLVVNDGRQNSNPDTVVITVLGPFTAKTSIQPEEIDRSDPRIEYVTVLMQLSEIAASDVDAGQPVVMTPGQILAGGQSVFDYRQGQTFMTTIMAVFDKAALMQAVPSNGGTTLTITGKLTSGRSFSGSAPVTIVGAVTIDATAPTPNPMAWAKADPTVKDPNDPNLYAGEPRAVLLDPRADNGTGETGWAITMRATKATDAKGGIEYQFDCFEEDALDRTWSATPVYTTAKMKRTDVVKYTFRCRARNKTGGATAWSKWAWVTETPKP